MKLTKKQYLIIAAVLVVLLFAYIGYREYDRRQKLEASERKDQWNNIGNSKGTQIEYSEHRINPFDNRLSVGIDKLTVFEKVKDVSAAEVKKLLPKVKNMPEKKIKKYFCEIINNHYPQKDWGGENNDIHATILQDGKQLSTSFMLKGKAEKGSLTIAKCGTTGNQILKLTSNINDIYFIQHVNHITEDVEKDVATKIKLKRHEGYNASYCLINGTDTARILKAYGYMA